MQAAHVEWPAVFHGIDQKPFDGQSMRYAFNDADAPTVRQRQYYEMFGNRAIWADGWKAVTLHANLMPWHLNKMLPFDRDKWELYHVAEDFSEGNDLAADSPDKLAELIEMFDEEAWRYNIYPLYDDMVTRIGKQQDRLFGDRTEFVYYAPGAVRIAEKAPAPVKNRSGGSAPGHWLAMWPALRPSPSSPVVPRARPSRVLGLLRGSGSGRRWTDTHAGGRRLVEATQVTEDGSGGPSGLRCGGQLSWWGGE